MNRIAFLAGLPRTGSTLLTELLKQNPHVYCSHESDLFTLLDTIFNSKARAIGVQSGLYGKNYDLVLNEIPRAYWKECKKKVIIDNNRGWACINTLPLMMLCTSEPKMIFTYRPLFEVLESFLSLCHRYPDSFIDKALRLEQIKISDEARCDWLLRPESQIQQILKGLLQQEPREMLVIHYDELCFNPNATLKKIETFLTIDPFKYNFEEITQIEFPYDHALYGIRDLHIIRNTIHKQQASITLTPFLREKYKSTADLFESLLG